MWNFLILKYYSICKNCVGQTKQIWPLAMGLRVLPTRHNLRITRLLFQASKDVCSTALSNLRGIWEQMIYENGSYLLLRTLFTLTLKSTTYLWNYSTINGNTEFPGTLESRTIYIPNRVEFLLNTKGS